MTDKNIKALTDSIALLVNRFDSITTDIQPTQLKQSHDIPISNLNFEVFDESNEPFKCYKERLENFFELKLKPNEHQDKLKAKILINCIGSKYYQLISSLTAPDLPSTRSYTQLIKLLEDHLCPAPNIYTEQHKFLSRTQVSNESIAEYIASLRKLTSTCQFNCENIDCKKSIASTFLRAQFIRGIIDSSIRERLLQESNLTFDKACEVALALETTKIGNHEISKSFSEPVQMVRSTQNKTNNYTQQQKYQQTVRPSFKDLGIDRLCLRCGLNNHLIRDCKRERSQLKCKSCFQAGHVSNVCIKTLTNNFKQSSNYSNIKAVTSDDARSSVQQENIDKIGQEPTMDDLGIYNMIDIHKNTMNSKDYSKFTVYVKLCSKPQLFEVDSGSPVSIICKTDLDSLHLNMPLEPTKARFRTYTGECFTPLGLLKLPVTYNGNTSTEELYVVNTPSAPILGRTWLRHLNISINSIDCQELSKTKIEQIKYDIIQQYKDVFEAKIGTIPNYKCSLKVKPFLKPVFLKARPVPYALKDKVEKELQNLEDQGVITRTEYSDWGSPLVIVPKPDGNVRLCIDYKVSLNPQLMDARYPIPKVDDIFYKMKGGKFYCTLDVHRAYHHLEVDDESKKLQTISTHKGSYLMNKLAFGVKTAPNEFQRVIDNAIQDLDGTAAYFDDIIIQGSTVAECRDRLTRCLTKMRTLNLHINLDKCQFFESEINYLGHKISFDGLMKTTDKIRAITEAPQPTNVDELRSFLGLTAYYSKFIPNASTILHPLHDLLRKHKKFSWTNQCEQAFTQVKQEISSDRVLVPFDPDLPLTLATDASPVGISGVLSNIVNGIERPITFISRSLTPAEKGYSQLDREALAVHWSFQKLYHYLIGKQFKLIVDNKPLQAIFNPSKSLPATTGSRLLRYATFLNGFDFDIECRQSDLHQNADYFSRAPLPCTQATVDEDYQLNEFTVNIVSNATVTFDVIVQETEQNPQLSELKRNLTSGKERNSDFHLHEGAVFYGNRIVIPSKLQPHVLKELHNTHTGIVKMKALARRYCYWKNIDKDIELMVKSCKPCCDIKSNPKKAPLHVWDEPEENWQRVHLDYAGPFKDQNFLILVDAKSKWPEVEMIGKSPTSDSTITMLREIFSRNGLPQILVSDNATVFTSSEFKEFCQRNGIRQRFIAPGHPSTNGQAERFVQTLKQKLKTLDEDKVSLKIKLYAILMQYRATPLSSGKTPSEQFLNRNIRTKLDLLKPVLSDKNRAKQPVWNSSISVGGRVQVRNYSGSTLWNYGTVVKQLGKVHYLIDLDKGYTVRRHIDQVRACEVSHTSTSELPNADLLPRRSERLRNRSGGENCHV